MTGKIDIDLFARLMRLSAVTRNDLLEYIGQTPALTEELVARAERGAFPPPRTDFAKSKDQKNPAA